MYEHLKPFFFYGRNHTKKKLGGGGGGGGGIIGDSTKRATAIAMSYS